MKNDSYQKMFLCTIKTSGGFEEGGDVAIPPLGLFFYLNYILYLLSIEYEMHKS